MLYKKLTQKEKSRLIETTVGKILIPEDYVLESVAKMGLWIFRKREGEVVKEIYFQEGMGRDHITSYIETNFHTCSVDILKLVPDFEYEYGGIKYTNKEEFKAALEMLLHFLELYGFDKLEQFSKIESGERLTRKYASYIMENADTIAKEKKEAWGLEGKTHDEQMEILSNLIEREKNKDFSEAEPRLAEIAAVYGELMIEYFGGRWEWHDYMNNALIDIKKSRKIYASGRPIFAVVNHWKGDRHICHEWNRIIESLERTKKLHDDIKLPWKMYK